MALRSSVEKQLSDLLHSLTEEGFLDANYVLAQSVKKVEGSFAFLELISNFRSDCQSTLRILTLELDQPFQDFRDMEIHCMKIKGSTSCMGARRMTLACGDLRRGISNRSKEECLLALNRIKHEFQILQEKFDLISQVRFPSRVLGGSNVTTRSPSGEENPLSSI